MQRDSYHSMSTPRHLAFTFFSWPGIFTQEQVWWAEVFLHVVQKQHSARSLHFRGLEFLRDVFIWRSEKQPPCAKDKICLDNRWRLCRSWNFSLQQKSYWRWSQDGGLKNFKETAVLLLCCCYGLLYRPQFSLARFWHAQLLFSSVAGSRRDLESGTRLTSWRLLTTLIFFARTHDSTLRSLNRILGRYSMKLKKTCTRYVQSEYTWI